MEDRRIRTLRSQLGLSQERFARLLGVSLQTVRRWEAGLSRPLPIISIKLDELQRELRDGPSRSKDLGKTEGERRSTDGLELGLGGLFKGLGGLLDLVSKMVDERTADSEPTGETRSLRGKSKGVYGISVKVGTGGKPVIEQFGNIKTTETGVQVGEVRLPMVDVLDEGQSLIVIAELPGAESDDIRAEIKDDILILAAEGEYRRYYREVLLPVPVEAEDAERSYKNGILEMRLKKRRPVETSAEGV